MQPSSSRAGMTIESVSRGARPMAGGDFMIPLGSQPVRMLLGVMLGDLAQVVSQRRDLETNRSRAVARLSCP